MREKRCHHAGPVLQINRPNTEPENIGKELGSKRRATVVAFLVNGAEQRDPTDLRPLV